MHTTSEPTIEMQDLVGTTSRSPNKEIKKGKTRKSKVNRFKIHVKENWVNYLFGLAIFGAGYFVVEAKVDIAKLFTISEFNKENVGKFEERFDKIDDYLNSQNASIKSLNDRFDLFIQLQGVKKP